MPSFLYFTSDTRYCHWLMCYRDDEDESKRRVTAIIDGIETQVNVTRIKLGEMVHMKTIIHVTACKQKPHLDYEFVHFHA